MTLTVEWGLIRGLRVYPNLCEVISILQTICRQVDGQLGPPEVRICVEMMSPVDLCRMGELRTYGFSVARR